MFVYFKNHIQRLTTLYEQNTVTPLVKERS